MRLSLVSSLLSDDHHPISNEGQVKNTKDSETDETLFSFSDQSLSSRSSNHYHITENSLDQPVEVMNNNEEKSETKKMVRREGTRSIAQIRMATEDAKRSRPFGLALTSETTADQQTTRFYTFHNCFLQKKKEKMLDSRIE